ncbi:MAG: hypothetical protein J6O61_14600 [Butyrivibrio sp.]|uniref:hypothetical protein n=1 Tax=Butyrivibrio sp. TaxID=28121 RepID=UPI001B141544|nr:hypothetical protein [Butyrivibrio sp.]MBO6242032.1 hypothetical protein [Butyrivibrio sp.]
MSEKRLSIRFRMDNPQDKEAWELLQRISEEKNISKNAVALRLICKGAVSTESMESISLNVVAERIAELVANKLVADNRLIKKASVCEKRHTTTAITKDEPQTDEYRAVSEDALSFLDEF